jgi:hypothetical protein
MSGGGGRDNHWDLRSGQWAGQAPLAGHRGFTYVPPAFCRLVHHRNPLSPPPVHPFAREAPIRWWSFPAGRDTRSLFSASPPLHQFAALVAGFPVPSQE